MPAQSTPATAQDSIAVLGIDIGKNVFHVIGLNARGAIVYRAKLSRTQLASTRAMSAGAREALSRRVWSQVISL